MMNLNMYQIKLNKVLVIPKPCFFKYFNMNYRFIILILFVMPGINYSQNKNFTLTYKIHFIQPNYDSYLNKIKNNNEAQLKLAKKNIEEERESIKLLKNINFILKYNKNESIYFMEKSLFTRKRNIQKIFPLISISDDREYYFNNKKLFMNLNAFGEDFHLEVGKVKWEITNETKQIGQYNCYKAIGLFEKSSFINKEDKKVIAWFTPDIPFNYGPKFYNGLPGLIIELKERKNLSYILKEIKREENQKILFQKKGKLITVNNLRNMSKYMLKNRHN